MAAGKLPAIHLYPGDWLRDSISGCSLAAQGLWLRLLFIAHDADRYGFMFAKDLLDANSAVARRCGCTIEEFNSLLAELFAAGVPGIQDGFVVSRRMIRDAKLRDVRAKAGRKGGKQTAKQTRGKSQANAAAKSQQNAEDEIEIEDDIEDVIKEVKKGDAHMPPAFELPASIRTDAMTSAVADWLAYKAERREAYKPTGLKSFLTQIANGVGHHGEAEIIRRLQKAMAHGYKGWDFGDAAHTVGAGRSNGFHKGPGHIYDPNSETRHEI